MSQLGDAYPWIKALHVISMIAWMAGLLYLPRLFVYHASAPVGSAQSETFKIMERRLALAIMMPASLATLGFGLLMVPDWIHSGWMHAKLALVVVLFGIDHGILQPSRRRFAADRNERSARYYRIVNEAPTLVMIAIVILVVVKPF
jgi:putative membrane protein